MTDQDNLRDRIAAQITPFLYWNYADWEDADERDRADARECAQAIIDELRTDEAVERVAVELSERHDRVPFDQMPEFIQNAWRADARACADALLGEKPCPR